jgi:hypothetical protein
MGDWKKKVHDETIHNIHSSPNIISIIKSRMIRWAGHVALMGEESIQDSGRKSSVKEATRKA